VTASNDASTGSPPAAMSRGMGSIAVQRARIAALVGIACALCAPRAAAEDTEPIHLAYDAPAGCASEAAFLDIVGRDGGQFVLAPETQPARSLLIHLEGDGPFRGTLVVRETDGTEATREMSGARCDDVVRSLAVLVALSLEPPVSSPSEPTPATLSPAPSIPPPAPAEPLPDVPGLAAAIPGTESPDPSGSSDDGPVSVRPPQGWRLDVSGETTLSTGAVPSLDLGLAAYVELLDETPSFLAPSIRVGVDLSKNQGDEFLTTVRRLVGRLDVCSFRLVLSRPWSDDAFTLEPCARIDVGRIDVEAFEPWAKVGAARLWVAPAGLLRLRWTSPRIFVELEGGVAVPLVRERFAFGPVGFTNPSPDFEVPPIALTTGLGFGVFIL
jgi:hypothetical protein